MLRVWFLHVLIGVPSAAFAHSVLQFAHDASISWERAWRFPIHFGLGLLVGSIILVPAYSLQALQFIGLRKLGSGAVVQMIAGGILQAGLVSLWAAFVGIEPSLAGNFPLTVPMIAAGFLVGAVVGAVVYRWAVKTDPIGATHE
jgi:hypothetical protein